MTQHFTDRLLGACREKGTPLCVGIDPVYERLPAKLRSNTSGAKGMVQAISRFVEDVLEIAAKHVACVKFQSACFERYLWPGTQAYHQLICRARDLGLIVIGDAKRGDIGISSEHYAAGCLGDTHFDDLGMMPGPDALTINAYLGADGMAPFIDMAANQGKGLFALVRTSNPGSDAIQRLPLADGRNVAEAVAQVISQTGNSPGLVGQAGYTLLGAVVGATQAEDAVNLRKLMPQQIFLVPGFGAQGATADDVRACFHDNGAGAIITASRSILYAYENHHGDWRQAIEQALLHTKQQIQQALGLVT